MGYPFKSLSLLKTINDNYHIRLGLQSYLNVFQISLSLSSGRIIIVYIIVDD